MEARRRQVERVASLAHEAATVALAGAMPPGETRT